VVRFERQVKEKEQEALEKFQKEEAKKAEMKEAFHK